MLPKNCQKSQNKQKSLSPLKTSLAQVSTPLSTAACVIETQGFMIACLIDLIQKLGRKAAYALPLSAPGVEINK